MSPVDTYKLGCNLASSTRLAHAKHNLGTLRFKRVDNLLSTSAKLNRYVQFYHLGTANSLGQRLHGLPSWIDFLATKRLKSGNQNLCHLVLRISVERRTPIAARCSPRADRCTSRAPPLGCQPRAQFTLVEPVVFPYHHKRTHLKRKEIRCTVTKLCL